MKIIVRKPKQLLFNIAAALVMILAGFLIQGSGAAPRLTDFSAPKPPTQAFEYSLYRTGPFEAAKVFGRATGCQNVTMEFIDLVSSTALKAGVDPRIAAATIAVESNCDGFAISSKGAVGIMQIRAQTWKNEFDFTEINLLNPQDNLKVGTSILGRLIQDYGVEGGIRRYNGTGTACSACDANYTEKILRLSGRK